MQTKNRQQLLIIGAVAAIVLFAGDRLILTPLGNAWTTRAKRIVKLKADVEDGRRLLVRDLSLRSRWKDMCENALPASTSRANTSRACFATTPTKPSTCS